MEYLDSFIRLIELLCAGGLVFILTLRWQRKKAMAEAKKAEAKAKALEKYYEKHPEERPVPPEEGTPEPTEADLLKEILGELKKQNEGKAKKAE